MGRARGLRSHRGICLPNLTYSVSDIAVGCRRLGALNVVAGSYGFILQRVLDTVRALE